MKYITLSFMLLASTCFASQFSIEKGKVEFVAKGYPSFIKINGKGVGLKGELSQKDSLTSGKFEFDLTQLTTDMDLRDDHMKNKYLEVTKFPKAFLVFKETTLKNKGKTQAELKIKNTSKIIPITYEIIDDGVNKKVMTSFQISLEKFEIEIPSFQGITVAKTIDLNVNFEAIRQ